MDMQPITASSLDPPSGGNRAANKRRIAYAKPFPPKSSSLSSAESTMDDSGNTRSPSKFPLLGSSNCGKDDSHSNRKSSTSKGVKRHGKKATKLGTSSQISGGTGRPSAGFKISRALFRDLGPKGHFSNMDFVASDATGNHKKQRSSNQRTGGNAYDMDSLASSPSNEQMSFDATSNTSDVGEPFTSTNERKQQQKQRLKQTQSQKTKKNSKPLVGILLNKKKNPTCVLEADRRAHEATISMESDASFQSGVSGPRKNDNSKVPIITNHDPSTAKPVAAEKAVVLEASEEAFAPLPSKAFITARETPFASKSNPTFTEETADPLTDCNIPSDIQEKLLARFELSACSPFKNDERQTPAYTKPSEDSFESDTKGSNGLPDLGQLSSQKSSWETASTSPNPDAVASTCMDEPPKLTSAKNVTAKKIKPLKPPPALPPKAPRKQYGSSSSKSNVIAEQNQHQQKQQKNQELRKHEQRLLQGGEFLNESTGLPVANAAGPPSKHKKQEKSKGGLALRILERLECTNFEQLMKEHYDQDPPITATNNQSSGNESSSSSSMVAAASNVKNNTATAQHPNGSSNTEKKACVADEGVVATNNNSYNNNSYAAFMLESDKSGSAASGGGGVEECKIDYMYSQEDNHEYDNSILTTSICSQVAKWPDNTSKPAVAHARPSEEKDKRKYSPVNPSMYRSDAINAFIEKAQSPKRCSVAKELTYNDAFAEAHGNSNNNRSDEVVDDDDDDHVAEEGPKIVSDDFLNLVTSGCTGGVASPEAKESLREKITALEAGWTDLRSQFSDRVNDLEETWKNWNFDSLLNFASPNKEPAPPVCAASATLQTTPSSEIPSNVWQMSREDTVTPLPIFTESEQVQCALDGRRAQPMTGQNDQVVRGAMDKFTCVDKNKGPAVERISIGSTEHDVPMSLKDTLADISGIEEGAGGLLHLSALKEKPVDSSGEDSEGGKVILDAAEWDPVEASYAEEVHVDLSRNASAAKGKYYKHGATGKVLRSPTSVLAEI